MDSGGAWDERMGWAFDLIADDPVRRARARGRLKAGQERRDRALAVFNETWSREGLSAAVLRDHPRYAEARRDTLPDALWEWPPAESCARWGGLAYVLLYLEWESRYPQEWTAAAKAWSTKGGLLHDLARAVPYLPEEVLDRLVELIRLAVRRGQRCADRGYAVLARSIGAERLRPVLAELAEDPDERFSMRARYLIWLLDHPELPKPKAAQWQAWSRTFGSES